MRKAGLLFLLATMMMPPARGQEKPPKEDAAHESLRTLQRQLVEAVNKSDLDGLLTHLDKDVVVTWMDGRVSRGPQGVREYIEKMTKGENRIVNSYKTEAEADELAHLYGDTGVANGHSRDQFVLTDGRDFVVNTRWSAALVKKDGKWKVAGFHASASLFDNPILEIAVRQTAVWTGGSAGVAGLAAGFAFAWLLRRPKASAQVPSPS